MWFCYAERRVTPEIVEVAGPWARITVPDRGAPPIVERLSDGVESLGAQGLRHPAAGVQALLVELRGGDPDGVPVRALRDWRAGNALIAADPLVVPHLPPVG